MGRGGRSLIAVDASALVAVLANEPDAQSFMEALSKADGLLIGTPTLAEAAFVIHGKDTLTGVSRLWKLVSEAGIRVVAFTIEHVEIAIDARRRYGRGTGHPAHLNLGDCLSYALAKSEGLPLLFKGDDFRHTDIEPALTEGNDKR